jgi:hypothetical protein
MLLLFSILAAWGDLEGGGRHGEGRERLPLGRRAREEGGRLQPNWGEERGAARVGEERGAPIHWIEINGPNLLSPLSSRLQRKKMPKDLLFSEECLLKLQTPMPQNIKEKRKISLTSFQKIWGITLYPP